MSVTLSALNLAMAGPYVAHATLVAECYLVPWIPVPIPLKVTSLILRKVARSLYHVYVLVF